jgi:hypothetical protein
MAPIIKTSWTTLEIRASRIPGQRAVIVRGTAEEPAVEDVIVLAFSGNKITAQPYDMAVRDCRPTGIRAAQDKFDRALDAYAEAKPTVRQIEAMEWLRCAATSFFIEFDEARAAKKAERFRVATDALRQAITDTEIERAIFRMAENFDWQGVDAESRQTVEAMQGDGATGHGWIVIFKRTQKAAGRPTCRILVYAVIDGLIDDYGPPRATYKANREGEFRVEGRRASFEDRTPSAGFVERSRG